MCTFERLLIDDAQTHVETLNSYYQLYDNEAFCQHILREFGYDNSHSHIINGHIPVNRLKGESPIKAGGRLIVIDGGFCHSYQNKTGTAGYTLVYNSYCMRIISHEPFEGTDTAISQNRDISSSTVIFDVMENHIPVSQTDDGALIKQRIEGLTMLLAAYQNGFLKELEQ
jgi:fructose-1,6-bisphosphatase-3